MIDYLVKNKDQVDKGFFEIKGWIVNSRGNKKIRFIDLNDGSTSTHLQIVMKAEKFDLEEVEKWRLGSAVYAKGIFHNTPTKGQFGELEAKEAQLLALSDEDYPIQKKETTLKFLRTIPHLRHRSNTLRAATIIRSSTAYYIHEYFRKHGFLWMASPIITSVDGEGAGEMFDVSTTEGDFFGKGTKATLGVTGQLQAEAYALGMKKVYTFAPTFRAENSNTTKHLAEFWMVEPEVAFENLEGIVKLAYDLVRYVAKNLLLNNIEEINMLSLLVRADLKDRLKNLVTQEYKIIDYRTAITTLQENITEFEEQDIKFGTDLATEHERFLAEVYHKGPIAIVNYPKTFKAFYMYQNDDHETVQAFDLLVPGIGELVGGSVRENRYDKLLERVEELKMHKEDLQWYLDLRKYGFSSSAGFGLGFERLVMYVTGLENIRDTIPFPRTPNNLKM